MDSILLGIRDLYTYFGTRAGPVKAVDGVSLNVMKGSSLALIGESGCGKSSLAKAIIRLLPRNLHTYRGQILLNGQDTMLLKEEEFRKRVRWSKISLVMQGAQNSLNPVIKIGQQVAEPLRIHKRMDEESALKAAEDVITSVGIPEGFAYRYPFELSGGMRQRAIIAMALIMDPEMIILDEPTSALDVLTQANIMNLLKTIRKEMDVTFMIITHDIGLSSELADTVAVMYAGQIVEFAGADRFYKDPLHPYSIKLMASVPTLRSDKKLEFIPGNPPSLIDPPEGCRFAPRCPLRFERCSEDPPAFNFEDHCYVRCWLHEEDGK